MEDAQPGKPLDRRLTTWYAAATEIDPFDELGFEVGQAMQRTARKRTTRQLEQVFKALQGDHSHPFAHQIYQRVHKKLPHISLATVYRNLHSLVEAGKIRSLLLDEQAARYDPETSEHDHFICERCGRVIDLFLKRVRRIDLTRLAKDGYVVTTHNLTVYGLCQVCARRRRTSRLSRARPESPRKNRGVRTLAVTRE